MEAFALTPGRRVLFLTKDPELIRRQLAGECDFTLGSAAAPPPPGGRAGATTNALAPEDLLDDVNTDQITPAWVCFDHEPARIALNAYAGLTNAQGRRLIPERALADGGFEVIVSGRRKGTGSSRETAAQAEKYAGIRLAVAESFAPIHARNNLNLGQLMAGYDALCRLQRGETLPREEFTRGWDPISRLILESGGLFAFARRLRAGAIALPARATGPRPMTMAEQVIAAHLVAGQGAPFVQPGDAVLVRVDGGYSHEFTTAQVHTFLQEAHGADYRLDAPERFAVFEDHLLYADGVAKMAPFADKIAALRRLQREFQRHTGVQDFNAVGGTSPGICHQVARERLLRPGGFYQATDSHTCMGGGLNALAWGVGATEYAALLIAGFTVVEVPESIRFELHGRLAPGVTAKDVMLHLLSTFAREEATLDRVMEFGGPGLAALSADERATLANMATECSAKTGVCEADERLFAWLAAARPGTSRAAFSAGAVAPDPGAHYHGGVHRIELAAIPPMVAKPFDPTNGAAVADLDETPIDIAYGGSCTAGKRDDFDMYAAVVGEALTAGRRLAPGVRFYIQYGSEDVRRYAEARGHTALFERAGIDLVNPGCGACIGCGPGVSTAAEQVTVSAINRNFTGRSGPGRLYLAGPLTVAASAFAGRIVAYRPGMFG